MWELAGKGQEEFGFPGKVLFGGGGYPPNHGVLRGHSCHLLLRLALSTICS